MADKIEDEALVELRSIREKALNPLVKSYLDSRIKELDHIVSAREQRAKEASSRAEAAAKRKEVATATAASTIPTVKLTTYAWDESDKFVKLYFDLKGIQSLASDKVVASFTEDDFEIFISDLNGKNYTITFKELLHNIKPNECSVKQKTDNLLVMLKKQKEKETWNVLTKIGKAVKDKSVPNFDKSMDDSKDPQASMMSMMKQMYDQGDDEMKRSLRKAWYEGQKGKAAGGPGLPDL